MKMVDIYRMNGDNGYVKAIDTQFVKEFNIKNYMDRLVVTSFIDKKLVVEKLKEVVVVIHTKAGSEVKLLQLDIEEKN